MLEAVVGASRSASPRLRVQARRSRTPPSNHRWAMDVRHIPCGQDGWGHLTAVIDGHDREIMGDEFALRGRAQEAERAIDAACLARFGTLRPIGATPALRSDNGVIFQSRRFRQTCRDDRLPQEFMTPYTPPTGWTHRTVFSESQREVRLATSICQLQGGPTSDQWLDAVVQRWTTTSSVAVSESSPVSTETRLTGGLISGGHYTRAQLTENVRGNP